METGGGVEQERAVPRTGHLSEVTKSIFRLRLLII